MLVETHITFCKKCRFDTAHEVIDREEYTCALCGHYSRWID